MTHSLTTKNILQVLLKSIDKTLLRPYSSHINNAKGNEMGRSAEAWQAIEEANEQQREYEMEQMYEEYQATTDVRVAVTLRSPDDLFNMMCAMNAARLEEMSK